MTRTLSSWIIPAALGFAGIAAYLLTRDRKEPWLHERLAGILGADGLTLRRRVRYKGGRKARSARRRLDRASAVVRWCQKQRDREKRARLWLVQADVDRYPMMYNVEHRCELESFARRYRWGKDLLFAAGASPEPFDRDEAGFYILHTQDRVSLLSVPVALPASRLLLRVKLMLGFVAGTASSVGSTDGGDR